MAALKERVAGLKPLGYVTANANELLVIYDGVQIFFDTVPASVTHK